MCLVLRTPYGGPAGKIYSQTPLNPYPFGGLLGYWLEELRLKKKGFLEVWVKEGFDCTYIRTCTACTVVRARLFFSGAPTSGLLVAVAALGT